MNESILFVDDENQILNSLRRVFSDKGFNIYTAESSVEALDILTKQKIDLLISDVRMPVMDGYQLLEKVKEKYPSIIRVVLSGYMDEELVVKMQRKNLAKGYILKPWKNQGLIQTIEQIFRIEKVLKSRNLLELINKIDVLPSPGNTFQRFNLLVEQNADMNKIAKAIECDQSVTAKILQIANSSFFGLRTGSIRQAVTYMGLTNVKYIILNAMTFEYYRGGNSLRMKKDIDTLWKHAVTTNEILPYFYNRLMGQQIPDMCSMVGLLHDIGKVVLINNFTDRYLKAAAAIKNKVDLFYYYEQMEFTDTTHQEIGAYLLNWWELPQPIVEAVLYHHNPLDENVTDKKLVSLLHIADIFSWNIICKGEYWDIDPEILKLFDISKEDCNQIIKEIKLD